MMVTTSTQVCKEEDRETRVKHKKPVLHLRRSVLAIMLYGSCCTGSDDMTWSKQRNSSFHGVLKS